MASSGLVSRPRIRDITSDRLDVEKTSVMIEFSGCNHVADVQGILDIKRTESLGVSSQNRKKDEFIELTN